MKEPRFWHPRRRPYPTYDSKPKVVETSIGELFDDIKGFAKELEIFDKDHPLQIQEGVPRPGSMHLGFSAGLGGELTMGFGKTEPEALLDLRDKLEARVILRDKAIIRKAWIAELWKEND